MALTLARLTEALGPAAVVTGTVRFELGVAKMIGAIGGYQIDYKFGKEPMSYDFRTVRKMNIGAKVALTLDATGAVLKVGDTRVESDGDCPADFPALGKGPKNKGKCCKAAWSNKCVSGPVPAKGAKPGKCPAEFPVIGKGPKNKGQCCKAAWSNKCDKSTKPAKPAKGAKPGKCPADFPVLGKGPSNKGKCCIAAYSNKCEGWKPWTRPSGGGGGGGGGGGSRRPSGGGGGGDRNVGTGVVPKPDCPPGLWWNNACNSVTREQHEKYLKEMAAGGSGPKEGERCGSGRGSANKVIMNGRCVTKDGWPCKNASGEGEFKNGECVITRPKSGSASAPATTQVVSGKDRYTGETLYTTANTSPPSTPTPSPSKSVCSPQAKARGHCK
jgi:hypothetical protein